MKKILSLMAFAVVFVFSLSYALPSRAGNTETEKEQQGGGKNTDAVGISYTIPGTYIAGTGSSMADPMTSKGLKLRTGQNEGTLEFVVNEGYVIKRLYIAGIGNYKRFDATIDKFIDVIKVEVDGVETSFTGGKFPEKGSSEAEEFIVENINATQSVKLYFDNSNTDDGKGKGDDSKGKGTQINASWAITYSHPEDIVVDVAAGDLTTAINAAVEGKDVKSLTLNLAAGAQYTLSETITISSDLTINGNGAIIDASTLETPMVSGNATAPTTWEEANVNISDLTIKGLNKALFYSAAKNTLYKNFIIDNCAIEVAADATTFDFTKGSVAENFTMTNSTVYAPTATTKQFYSSQSGQKATEAGDIVQTFTFKNNTMYNLAKGKNFFSHRQSNQKWLAYDVENNIFVNCGKSGQVIKGMNGGQGGANPTWTISGNIFNYDGADTSAAEETGDADEPVKNSVAGVVEFTDAANGDFNGTFTLAEGATGSETAVGDQHWTVKGIQIPVDIVISPADGDIAAALTTASEGRLVKSITINLTDGGEYTMSAPIECPADLVVNGNGAAITMAEGSGDVIKLNGTETFAKKADGTDSDHKLINKVEISKVKILSLQGALITDAQKTLLENLTISDAVIEMPAAGKNVINFSGKGYVGEVIVKNSTIYAKGMNTGFFAQYGSRPKNVNGDWLQAFDVQNSTIVNIANGKNICDLKQNGTAQNVYTLKNNIFVDCGKQNQVVVGFNKGQTSATPVWDVDGNTFLWGGKDVSAAETDKAGKKAEEDIVKNSLPYNEDFGPLFADAANGDFTIGAGTPQAKMQTGAPQWLVPYDFARAPEYTIDVYRTDGSGEIDVTVPEYYRAGDVYITLENGEYKLKTPIKAGGGDFFAAYGFKGFIFIEGYDATLDVSELDGPMIQIEGSIRNAENADGTENTTYKYLDYIRIDGLNIKGLKQPLVKDNQKTLVEDIFVVDCVIDVNGSKNIFDFNGKGYPGYLAVYNSTLASENGHTGYFLQSSGRVKDLDSEQDTYRQYIDIDGCTLYKIAKGKQMNNLNTKGQKSLALYLYNSLLFDTGSAGGNTVRGWLGGQLSKNPFVSYENNSYWADDAEATDWYDSTKDGSDQSGTQVYGKPFFRKLTNSESWYTGDFTLGVCAQIGKEVGDPRWYNIAMITQLQDALAQAASLLFDAQRTWSLVDADNDRIAKLAAAYKDNKPFLIKSKSQEDVNAATARVLAAIAEFLGEDIAGDATAIESVNSAKVDNGAWYTINGQRVERPAQKGLYIHNGRKVVVK